MTMKSHLKFEEKLTCGLENNEQFGKFSSEHLKTSKLIFSCDPFVWSRKCMSKLTEEWWKIWRGIDLSFQNWHKEFDKFWLENSKVLKIYTLTGWFWPNYIWVKKVQRSYAWLHSRLIQSLKENWLVFPKIDMRNLANFHQSTRKSPNWGLNGILFNKLKILLIS